KHTKHHPGAHRHAAEEADRADKHYQPANDLRDGLTHRPSVQTDVGDCSTIRHDRQPARGLTASRRTRYLQPFPKPQLPAHRCMEDRMDLVSRVKGILLNPKSEWATIDTEPASVVSLYTGYIIPLAAIPAICGFIGMSIIGTALIG